MKKYSLAKKLSCVIAGVICFAVPLNASAANLPRKKILRLKPTSMKFSLEVNNGIL